MTSHSELVVTPVTNSTHWKDFYNVRRMVYRDDPAAVIPLKSMELIQLDEEKNPFYEHARRAVFVCYQNNEPVGRIAAIKDDLHNEFYQDKVGFFGFFECINCQPVANLLIETAKNWLIENGCNAMRGPVNPSMKSDFGVLTEGHEIPPFIMMGHTPLFYDELLRNAQFQVAKKFFAYRYNWKVDLAKVGDKWDKLIKSIERIKRRYPQLKFRTVDRRNYDETLRDINSLGNVVRSGNYGFVPLTEAELKFMISQMRRIIRFDMIHAAYWEDELVGFIVNVPDLNWALKKATAKWQWLRMLQLGYWIKKTPRSRVIALGVHEKFRKKGIAIILIDRLRQKRAEYDEWEFSWVVEDNVKSMGAISATMPLVKHKSYQLYEKAI